MANYLNPFSGRQFIDASGTPYSGAKLFIYQAGTSTKITTYKDSAGASSHTNPIVLNSKGEPADGAGASQAIWHSGLYSVKLVLAPSNDTDPPTSSISTWDNIGGINDISDQRSDTGAVEFTLHEYHENRPINVVTDFGAAADGVTDDTAEIQAAIDALNAAGGGDLLFPHDSVFGISATIYVYSNIRLIGQGFPVIRAIGAIEGAMIQFGKTTATITDADTNPCHNSSIEGIEVDGNDLVTAKDWDPLGLLAAGLDSALVYVWRNSTRNKILNCKIHSAECDIVGSEDGSDFLEVVGNEIYGLTTTSAASQFANLINVDGSTNAIISNNKIHTLTISGYAPSTWGYGIRLHATDSSSVRENSVSTGYYNILIDGRSNVIAGNRFTSPENSSVVLYQNNYGCRYNSIINNFIDNDPDTYTPTGYGIRENLSGTSPDAAKVTHNYIAGNVIANASTPLVILDTSYSYAVANTSVTGNVDDGTASAQPTENTITDTIKSGNYTPTLSHTTNVAASTAYECQYIRVGRVVTVSGMVDIDPTATGATELRMTIPVGENFTAAREAAGTFGDSYDQHGTVIATVGAATVRLQANLSDATNRSYYFHFTYNAQLS